MNRLDSALVSAALKTAHFSFTDNVSKADVVLINTCSVRQHAEDKVFSHLGHLKHIKKSRPVLIVAVIGCMAQRLGAELLAHEAVDIVCGPDQIYKIPQLLARRIEQKNDVLAVAERIRQKAKERQVKALDDFESTYGSPDPTLPGQAYVRAMRGCNKFCSYCVVPYVRGPEISRPPTTIIQQINRLVDCGIKQITLLGQTINSYKYTTCGKTYFLADLLEMVCAIESVKRVRFITSYPADFDESILRAMADLPKVCPYLHIPAQSGSDKILKAMNRRYSVSEYLELLDKAKSIVQGVAIAGDFIVGFPGETEADFQATVELVRRAQYKNCFVFKYSARPGTAAEKRLQDTVDIEVKKKRNNELLAVQETVSNELSKRFLGKTVEVLVEGLSKKAHLDAAESKGKPQLVGRTAKDYIVVFNGPAGLAGEFVKVKITGTSPLTLFGSL